MQEQNDTFYVVDLRTPLKFLFKRWLIIILITIVFGIIGLIASRIAIPRYQSAAYLSFDFSILGDNIDPISYMYSDEIRDQVSTALEIPIKEIPNYFDTKNPKYSNFKYVVEIKHQRANAYEILVTTTDPQVASNLANEWAAAIIQNVDKFAIDQQRILDDSKSAVEVSDAELLKFLEKNDILDVSMLNMAIFTGTENPNILLGDSFSVPQTDILQSSPLFSLGFIERTQLTSLLLDRFHKKDIYLANAKIIEPTLLKLMSNPPQLTGQGVTPSDPVNQATLFTSIISALIGGILIITVLISRAWYKNDWGV